MSMDNQVVGPYVKDIPNIKFPAERMDFEVRAISLPEV